MAMPDLPQVELAIIEMTNAFRAENGVGEVKRNDELTRAARAYAAYLARTGKFSHSADGRGPADRTQEYGYKHCFVGENLALNLDSRGFETRMLAAEAMDGWRKSPSHRANMLRGHVVEIGVGVVRAPDQHPKFISVQLFGRPDTLTVTFRVSNHSDTIVRYALDKDVTDIQPHVQMEHQLCVPTDIVFETTPRVRYKPRAGVTYTITQRQGGGVRIDTMTKSGGDIDE